MRTVTVEVKVKLLIKLDDDARISEIIDEMEHDFSDNTGTATIEDSEILDYEVMDSR